MSTQAELQQVEPLGHAWVTVQPGTQAFEEQIEPAAQSSSATHVTQVLVEVSQTRFPLVLPAQSPLVRQPTQVCDDVSHTTSPLVLPAQSLLVRQPTQVCDAVSHTLPLLLPAQPALLAQPATQVFVESQYVPAAQTSLLGVHATQSPVVRSHTGPPELP